MSREGCRNQFKNKKVETTKKQREIFSRKVMKKVEKTQQVEVEKFEERKNKETERILGNYKDNPRLAGNDPLAVQGKEKVDV